MTMTTKEVMVKREREDNMMENCTPKTSFLKLSDKGKMVEIQLEKISTQEHFDTFGGLLRAHPDISCDVIVAGQDIEPSFEWDSAMSLTEYAGTEFKGLLESGYEILPNGNIEIFYDHYGVAERFFYSVAGYCSNKEYDKLFVWED